VVQQFKAGMPGREVDFLVLADHEDPKSLGPHIEVTYRRIQDVLGWQHYAKMRINRDAFHRDLPRVIDGLTKIRPTIRAMMGKAYPKLAFDVNDPESVKKFQTWVSGTPAGKRFTSIMRDVQAISREVMVLRSSILSGKAPAGEHLTVLNRKARVPEDILWQKILEIRNLVFALEPYIGEGGARTLADMFLWDEDVILTSGREDRRFTTSTRAMLDHLGYLESIGFVDWFELNFEPTVGPISEMVTGNKWEFMKRVQRFILFRVPTYTVDDKNIIRPDKNRTLVFAPALFRTIQAMQNVSAGRASRSMFGKYMPVIRTNEISTKEATMQAVADAILAAPIGEPMGNTTKTMSDVYPSPVEMALTSVSRMVVPRHISDAMVQQREEDNAVRDRVGLPPIVSENIFEKYVWAKPIYGGKGGWAANMDLVWWWVYGQVRKRVREAYVFEDANSGGEIDRATGYLHRVVIRDLQKIHLYEGQAKARRTVLQGDYRFIVDRSLEHVNELIQFLGEEKLWKKDPASRRSD